MADYVMPSHLSDNAKDLIDRLLKKNPKDRIRLRDIIKHPFITSIEKYRQSVSIFQIAISLTAFFIEISWNAFVYRKK